MIGGRVRVFLRASEVIVLDGRTQVCRHARSVTRGSQTLVLDHYLEVLARKPGAMPGATALVQARQAGTFTAGHDAFWAAARRAHEDGAGARALIEVLLLHRHLPATDVLAGISAARAGRAAGVQPDPAAPGRAARRHPAAAVSGPLRPAPEPPGTSAGPATAT